MQVRTHHVVAVALLGALALGGCGTSGVASVSGTTTDATAGSGETDAVPPPYLATMRLRVTGMMASKGGAI